MLTLVLTLIIVVYGPFLSPRLDEHTEIVHYTRNGQEANGRVPDFAVALKGVRDLGIIRTCVSNVEHVYLVGATITMALRLECMDRGKSRWNAQNS